MKVLVEPTAVFAQFGEAFAYPGPELVGVLAGLRESLAEREDSCALKVDEFVRYIEDTPIRRIEEQYTRAFDIAPIAVPYLSVYLFGAENPQRGAFMAGLMEAYEKAGHACGGELPDHIAVLLRYAPKAPPGEWEELCEHCLPTPLRLMRIALEEAKSPYAQLADALRTFVLAFGENRDA